MTASILAGDLARRLDRAVDAHTASAVELSADLRAHPELGWSETFGSARVASWLRELGLDPTVVGGTGLRATLPGGGPGPTVALLGELDAVHLPTHPEAARDGAAHACGHHASLAAACLAAAALAPVASMLAGSVVVVAVPAEEMLPPARLATLRADRPGLRPTGKSELLATGDLDDVDLALMVHTGREGGPRFSVGDTLRGAVAVTAELHGTAAHGGSSPELGVDAVRAARTALDLLDRLAELRPELGIAAGVRTPEAALGSVPARCDLDVLVRGDSTAELEQALDEVLAALRGGAASTGAGLRWSSELAYAPTRTAPLLDDLVAASADEVLEPEATRARGRSIGASSDIGDLGLVMPVSHPYSSGAAGHHHSPSYHVVDPRLAVVEPARYLARSVARLLVDDGAAARRVLAGTPTLSRAAYDDLRARFDRKDPT